MQWTLLLAEGLGGCTGWKMALGLARTCLDGNADRPGSRDGPGAAGDAPCSRRGAILILSDRLTGSSLDISSVAWRAAVALESRCTREDFCAFRR